MTTIATLSVALGLDTSAYQKGLIKVEADSKGFGGRVGGFLSNALSFATGGALLNGIQAIGSSIGGITSSMIDGNAEFERYNGQFTTLLGSAGAAKQRMDDLAKFAANTPFELPDVVKADMSLQNFGFHAENVKERFGFTTEQIQTLAGDAASGVHIGFDEMANYMGKFASGSTGEVISRFQELGIVTKTQLTEMGLAFDKGGALIINSQADMDKATGVLMTAMQQKYGGGMEAQSKTFEGMVSNLEDWKAGTIRALGAPIFEVIKDKLGVVLDFLNKPETKAALDSFAKGLAQGIGVAMDWLSNTAIPALVDGWHTIQPALETTGVLIDKVTKGFSKGGLMGAIEAILPEMKTFGNDLGAQLGVWGEQFLAWLPGATVKLLTGALDMLGKFGAFLIAHGPDILLALGEWELGIGKWILTKGLPMLANGLLTVAAGLWDYMKDKWNAAFASDSIGGSIVDSMKNGIISKWDSFKGWFLENLASIIPGGQATLSALGIAPGRALGGQVTAGRAYTVGELGRETFVPGVSGSIVPNGGAGGLNVTVHVAGSVVSERELGQAVRQVLLDFKRRNPTAGLA